MDLHSWGENCTAEDECVGYIAASTCYGLSWGVRRGPKHSSSRKHDLQLSSIDLRTRLCVSEDQEAPLDSSTEVPETLLESSANRLTQRTWQLEAKLGPTQSASVLCYLGSPAPERGLLTRGVPFMTGAGTCTEGNPSCIPGSLTLAGFTGCPSTSAFGQDNISVKEESVKAKFTVELELSRKNAQTMDVTVSPCPLWASGLAVPSAPTKEYSEESAAGAEDNTKSLPWYHQKSYRAKPVRTRSKRCFSCGGQIETQSHHGSVTSYTTDSKDGASLLDDTTTYCSWPDTCTEDAPSSGSSRSAINCETEHESRLKRKERRTMNDFESCSEVTRETSFRYNCHWAASENAKESGNSWASVDDSFIRDANAPKQFGTDSVKISRARYRYLDSSSSISDHSACSTSIEGQSAHLATFVGQKNAAPNNGGSPEGRLEALRRRLGVVHCDAGPGRSPSSHANDGRSSYGDGRTDGRGEAAIAYCAEAAQESTDVLRRWPVKGGDNRLDDLKHSCTSAQDAADSPQAHRSTRSSLDGALSSAEKALAACARRRKLLVPQFSVYKDEQRQESTVRPQDAQTPDGNVIETTSTMAAVFRRSTASLSSSQRQSELTRMETSSFGGSSQGARHYQEGPTAAENETEYPVSQLEGPSTGSSALSTYHLEDRRTGSGENTEPQVYNRSLLLDFRQSACGQCKDRYKSPPGFPTVVPCDAVRHSRASSRNSSADAKGRLNRSENDSTSWQPRLGLSVGDGKRGPFGDRSQSSLCSSSDPSEDFLSTLTDYRMNSNLNGNDGMHSQVPNLLNNVSHENRTAVVQHLRELKIVEIEQLTSLVSIFFQQVIDDPTNCELYAAIVNDLRGSFPEFPPVHGGRNPLTFERVLISACQNEFECGLVDAEECLERRKNRSLANMRFIGQLFLRNVVSAKVIGQVILDLLNTEALPTAGEACPQSEMPSEHSIECVCEIVSAIGPILATTSKGAKALAGIYDKLETLQGMHSGVHMRRMWKQVLSHWRIPSEAAA